MDMLTEEKLKQVHNLIGPDYMIVPVKAYNDDAELIRTLQQQNAQMKEALEWIREYWNRDQNEAAMADACWKVIEIADNALQSLQGDTQ